MLIRCAWELMWGDAGITTTQLARACHGHLESRLSDPLWPIVTTMHCSLLGMPNSAVLLSPDFYPCQFSS